MSPFLASFIVSYRLFTFVNSGCFDKSSIINFLLRTSGAYLSCLVNIVIMSIALVIGRDILYTKPIMMPSTQTKPEHTMIRMTMNVALWVNCRSSIGSWAYELSWAIIKISMYLTPSKLTEPSSCTGMACE